jgi:hypothetical protein
MNVENRAAEGGSEIIDDTAEHSYVAIAAVQAIAIRILEDTVINTLTSSNVINVAYYDGAVLTSDSPVILGNFDTVQLTSGAVQVIFTGP